MLYDGDFVFCGAGQRGDLLVGQTREEQPFGDFEIAKFISLFELISQRKHCVGKRSFKLQSLFLADGVLAGGNVGGRDGLVCKLASADQAFATAAAKVVVDSISQNSKQERFEAAVASICFRGFKKGDKCFLYQVFGDRRSIGGAEFAASEGGHPLLEFVDQHAPAVFVTVDDLGE